MLPYYRPILYKSDQSRRGEKFYLNLEVMEPILLHTFFQMLLKQEVFRRRWCWWNKLADEINNDNKQVSIERWLRLMCGCIKEMPYLSEAFKPSNKCEILCERGPGLLPSLFLGHIFLYHPLPFHWSLCLSHPIPSSKYNSTKVNKFMKI